MEFLLVVLLLGVFLGPSLYRIYERYKRRKQGGVAQVAERRSYLGHLLRMLAPVYALAVFLALVAFGLYFLAGR